ncbi:hypothetical protein [Methylomicrobium lacus]|uniref:hypothetical protein n=1 Tax=Methylomicrobium lacus TaxID=136992 RepID=UPI0035A8CD77
MKKADPYRPGHRQQRGRVGYGFIDANPYGQPIHAVDDRAQANYVKKAAFVPPCLKNGLNIRLRNPLRG